MPIAALSVCKNAEINFHINSLIIQTIKFDESSMEPDWNDFKVLLALARGGSVAGAARELNIDHSTVSRRLAALEESVGARLIVRGGREFAWTVEGRTALAAAEIMETAVQDATRSLRAAKLEAEGVVRVSCSPSFVPLLVGMLPAVRAKHPLLDIEVSGNYNRVDLAKGEADIAIRMSSPSEPDLIARRVLECGWCVYTSKKYVAANGLPATFDELAKHRLVLYVTAMHSVAMLRWMENYKGTGTQVTRVDNLEVMSQILLSGNGIGVLPCFLGDEMPELIRVFSETIGSNTGYIVFHEAVRNTVRVRATIDALIEFFDSRQNLFAGQRSSAGGNTQSTI
jgi:DNA-binding transcriptional LysR family regulator